MANDIVLTPVSTPSNGVQNTIDNWVNANYSGVDIIAPAILYVSDKDFITAIKNVLLQVPGKLVAIVCVGSNLTPGILDELKNIAANRKVKLHVI